MTNKGKINESKYPNFNPPCPVSVFCVWGGVVRLSKTQNGRIFK
ncbi:hypothetical protein [Moraxella lacunata]